ncbi:MAG: HIT domain-containing protein [Actinomycetales bacterium]|nr:HIT domain-containing protein [Candidatus Lutibacillus vidarii]
MALYAVTPGHLLVIPRRHAVGLDDLDPTTSAHVWPVGHQLARALRRTTRHPALPGRRVLLGRRRGGVRPVAPRQPRPADPRGCAPAGAGPRPVSDLPRVLRVDRSKGRDRRAGARPG